MLYISWETPDMKTANVFIEESHAFDLDYSLRYRRYFPRHVTLLSDDELYAANKLAEALTIMREAFDV